jgi:pyrroloquinoline quinone biosynthesis protein B
LAALVRLSGFTRLRLSLGRFHFWFSLGTLAAAAPGLAYPDNLPEVFVRLKILGSAAGGGFPQWNCACRNCDGLRKGAISATPRTQAQIAFEINPDYALRRYWSLVNASPDLRSQILRTPDLAPFPTTTFSTPVSDVYLTSADVDSLMGLLHLREFQRFRIFSLPAIRRIVSEENALFRVLGRSTPPVQWFDLALAYEPRKLAPPDQASPPKLNLAGVPLGGDYPDYIGEKLRSELPRDEASVALALEYQGKRVFIAAALSGRTPHWKRWVEESDLVLLDGTFWSDDELQRTGRSKKTAREIGHLPLSGSAGLIEQYPRHARGRKILFHINNTNPVLDEQSAERAAVLDAGFEIAYDGMELVL